MSPRDRILARRARFIAAAVAASGVVACGSSESSTPEPQVCLSPAYDAGPDLGAEAAVCLSPALDSSVSDSSASDATRDALADTASDTAPTPCLDVVPDTGVDAELDTFDAEPAPCLKVAPDAAKD
jgi:hypothetical protein